MSEIESESESAPQAEHAAESSGLHLHQVAAGVSSDANKPSARPATTTEFVRKAVADQPTAESARLLLPKDAGMISAETLLAIVSYCYAKGIYSCRDIETAMLQDRALRESIGAHLPSDSCLRRFRRLNRSAIESILEKTFLRAKRELGCIPSDQGAGSAATQAPTASEPGQTTFLARQAAVERLQKALFIDGMTRDC